MTDQEKNKSGHKLGKRGGKPHYTKEPKPKECDRVIRNGSNDVHWYGSDEIIKLSGNLSFFKALGTRLELFTTVPTPGTIQRDVIPGIMFIDILDTLPVSNGTSTDVDAVNIAAKQQYALIRKANSGAKNYEWTDLIIYEMARSTLNEIYAFVCRAYGVANKYNMQNRYMPAALLNGMGFDATDFISNLATIRLYINNLAKRINTLALPHSLSYFERKAWLYSHIYVDASSAKAQLYVLNPGSNVDENAVGTFLLYDPVALSTGGCLRPHSIFATGNTFADWKVQVDNFIDAILADDDSAIISGDILKAYGDNNLFQCNPIPEDYVVEPICDYEVLSQIENLTVAPSYGPSAVNGESDALLIALGKGYIAQDGAGNLMSKPYFLAGSDAQAAQMYQRNPILNYHKTDVTPSDVMVGTRLTTFFDNYVMGADNNLYVPPRSNGTEIVTRLRIQYSPSAPLTFLQGCQDVYSVSRFSWLFDIMAFDWCPKVFFYMNSGGTNYIIPPLGDYETYRVLQANELEKLHDTAVLYMFGVPLIDNYAH